ncbi:MAG: 30S ribosomal protein S6 [Myxococcales bacterium]|nr:30S ribosomal protein S6 [Myxococcales bacterium]
MSRVALAQGHAREFETIYILRPNIEREKATDVAGKLNDAITTTKGVLTTVELWGQRRLAYPIAKHHRGVYVFMKYLGKGDTVAEIERQLRLSDSVLRYQTIQLRNNVLLETVTERADLASVSFEVAFEPDEPEFTVERELGLDAQAAERRRRDRDTDPEEFDGLNDEEGAAAGARNRWEEN